MVKMGLPAKMLVLQQEQLLPMTVLVVVLLHILAIIVKLLHNVLLDKMDNLARMGELPQEQSLVTIVDAPV